MIKEYVSHLILDNNEQLKSMERSLENLLKEQQSCQEWLRKLQREKNNDASIFSPRSMQAYTDEKMENAREKYESVSQKIDEVREKIECYKAQQSQYAEMLEEVNQMAKEDHTAVSALPPAAGKLNEGMGIIENAGETAEESTEENAGETAEESAEKNAEETAEKSAEENVEKAAEKTAQESTDKNVEKTAGENTEENAEETVGENTKKNVEETIEENTENDTKGTPEQHTEQSVEESIMAVKKSLGIDAEELKHFLEEVYGYTERGLAFVNGDRNRCKAELKKIKNAIRTIASKIEI